MEITFTHLSLVNAGKPSPFTIPICCSESSTIAPIHRDDTVRNLVFLQADLSHLSEGELARTITKRADGKDYYTIRGVVEATFYSASMKYVLLCLGKRYDTVTAEYVQ